MKIILVFNNFFHFVFRKQNLRSKNIGLPCRRKSCDGQTRIFPTRIVTGCLLVAWKVLQNELKGKFPIHVLRITALDTEINSNVRFMGISVPDTINDNFLNAQMQQAYIETDLEEKSETDESTFDLFEMDSDDGKKDKFSWMKIENEWNARNSKDESDSMEEDEHYPDWGRITILLGDEEPIVIENETFES
jgi:hypothetical protein